MSANRASGRAARTKDKANGACSHWTALGICHNWHIRLVAEEKPGKQYVVVMTARYTELTKETPTVMTTAATVAAIFFNDCISSYRVPTKVLTDTGPQVSSRFYKATCLELEIVPFSNKGIWPPVQRPSTTIQGQLYLETTSLWFRTSTGLGEFLTLVTNA